MRRKPGLFAIINNISGGAAIIRTMWMTRGTKATGEEILIGKSTLSTICQLWIEDVSGKRHEINPSHNESGEFFRAFMYPPCCLTMPASVFFYFRAGSRFMHTRVYCGLNERKKSNEEMSLGSRYVVGVG